MTAAVDAPRVEVPRNRWQQPMIQPVDGGKLVPYARASSWGDVLDDRTQLEKWKIRMAIHGLTKRKDLWLRAVTTPFTDKWALNKLADEAIEAAGGSSAANTGTVLHALTERIDRGEDPGPVPDDYAPDLAAYIAATAPFRHVSVERFVVNDELGVAGTPDRVSDQIEQLVFQANAKTTRAVLPPAIRITDLKSGGSADFLDKHAVQLAIYSRSSYYDPATGERTPIVDVAQDWGVLFHMPAGQGRCNLHALDLQAGWEGALLAADVRKWRKRKGICTAVGAA